RIRQSDWPTPASSPSHCSAYWAESAAPVRERNPSSRRSRAALRSPPAAAMRVPLAPALAARGRPAAAASNPAGRDATLELSPECGVFGNDFLILLGFDRRAARRRRSSHGFRILQVCVDGRHDDPRLNRNQIDADEGNTHPRVDDDALVENAIKDVDETRSAGGSFNGHRGFSCTASLQHRGGTAPGHRRQSALQRANLFSQLLVLRGELLLARRQMVIELPPVEP